MVNPATINASSIVTIDPIPYSGTIIAGLELNGGTVAWSDGLGFTSTNNQIDYNPDFTAGDQTRTLTATYTDACGDVIDYFYYISSTSECIASVPVFYYNDGSGWIDPATVDADNIITIPPIQFTATIRVGVHLNGGSIVWTDDQGTGFNSTEWEFIYDHGFDGSDQDRILTATYTDTCGGETEYTYNITIVCSPPVFTYNDNNGSDLVDPATVATDNTITIDPIPYSGTIQVGIKDLLGGSVTWSDGLGFTSSEDNFTYDPDFTASGQERTLIASYTDFCGDTTDYSYNISSNSDCNPPVPTFYYNTGNGNSSDVNLDGGSITITSIRDGDTVIIGVNLYGGTIEWSDNNSTTSFTGTDSEFTYDPGFTAGSQTRTLTGEYTGPCGNIADFVYNLSSLDDCVPNNPTATSPQIVCPWDYVSALVADVDAGSTLLWYTDETGGTPLDQFDLLIPGNYYAAAVNTDGTCESPRKLVVVATNNALYFDGNNDLVTLDTNPIQDGSKAFTIEAWIKPDASNYTGTWPWHAIFGSVQEGGNETRSPSFYMSNQNSLGGLHFDSYSDVTLENFSFETPATDTPLIGENVWSHIAVVNDGAMYTLYVNGKLILTADAPPQGVNVTEGTLYAFGRVNDNFAGLIDEARFWDVARTASEIEDNMQVDLTGNESGLVAYYTFNQGTANGNNTAMDNLDPPNPLYDSSTTGNTGLIRNFALEGSSSNFVGGYFAQIIDPSSTTAVSSTTAIGGTVQLEHTTPDGTWSSDPVGIATVDTEGLVTGISAGTAVITYEFCGVSTTYEITVIPNEGPTISQIEGQETCPGTSIADLSFIIDDDATPLNSLVLEATSSNTDLIPNDQIILGGTDENRTVSLSPVSGGSGTATITITATDLDDMFSTMSFDVIFTDTTKPTVLTKDIEVELDANGEVTITGDQINDSSNDDCTDAANLILAASPSSFSCANIGENTVTLTVTDASGNFETSTAIVTISDATKPTVITKNISVVLDATDAATITADMINNGSTDTCTNTSDLSVSVSPSSFSCADLGENTVILKVTDIYGNENTETAIVTVTETNAPIIITKPLTVTLEDNGYVSISADELDNGSTDSCGDVYFTASKLDFSCNDLGENTITLTVTDESGNTSTSSEIVTVLGSTKGCGIKISEAITANGDGINDTWMIYNIELHPNTSVRVFNRWGAQVYYNRDYKNDWDGNSLPSSGSYYYQVDVDGDGTIDNKGWLYITK